ncbi:MAG: VWA domain-containing protein [Spirochaetales bacterium]|nr:VWA domain-containing protein [Spirochaetales bacterium]
MIIEKPEYLWFILLIIPFSIHYYFSFISGKKDILNIGGKWRFESIYNIYLVKYFFIFLFFILCFIFSILSLADFKWGEKLVEDNRSGYDIVICLDISVSMRADDIIPNRMAKAVAIINKLIDDMWNSKFGIVIFKGKAVRIWPLTDDLEAIKLFLKTVSPDLITSPGSDLEDGIRVSLDTFNKGGRYQAIVLFSDGENTSRNTLKQAKAAGERGIPIISVICGTEKGSKISLDNRRFVTDTKGKIVVSRADRQLLKTLSAVSNGKAFEIFDSHKIKEEILSIVTKIEDENLDRSLKLEKNDGYRLFLYFAICFLILALITRGLRWRNIF